MPLIKIARRSDLPAEGKVQEFKAGEKMVCIACVNGVYSALENWCVHRGGPLGQGVIEGGKVVCPWHRWEFDIATGRTSRRPHGKVAVYPVTIEGDDVFVEI